MTRYMARLLLSASLCFVFAAPAAAETIKCKYCGMISDLASKFTSRIIDGDKTLYFCDIGDLLTHVNSHKPRNARVEVRDYETGEWIDGQKSFYVHSGKKFNTPMGWDIASFKERKGAEAYGSVMDFEGAAKAVR